MRVLLVEDDLMIGQGVALALKDAAYAVDWVRDGVAAMSTISTQSYDLMLLDLGLPRKDGIEVQAHPPQRIGLACADLDCSRCGQ